MEKLLHTETLGRVVTPITLTRDHYQPRPPHTSHSITTNQIPSKAVPRVKTSESKKRKYDNDLPEHLIQFLYKPKFETKRPKARIDTSSPKKTRSFRKQLPRKIVSQPPQQLTFSLPSPEKRCYKPQIIQISPRSKLKVYSPFSIQEVERNCGSVPRSIASRMTNTRFIRRSVNIETERTEEVPRSLEVEENFESADTYGLKLWRLTELSPVSWFATDK